MADFVSRPSPFALLSTLHGAMIVNVNDYNLNSAQQPYGVGYQLFANACYDPHELELCKALIGYRREFFGNGGVVLDCGANIGVHTIELAKHTHGWGEVIAFEAQERIYYCLAGNIALNNCLNARAHLVALGAESGMLRIPRLDYTKRGSFGSLELVAGKTNEFIGQTVNYAPEQMQSIRLLTLDELNLPRIDFIKMDIEGMEFAALRGAERSLSRCRPLMHIETIKLDKAQLYGWLAARGYEAFENGANTVFVHKTDPSRSRLHGVLTRSRSGGG